MDRNWIEKHVQGWTKLYQSVDEDAGYRLDDPCKRKSSIQVMEDLIGGDLPKDLKDFFQSVSSCIALKARLSPSLPTDLSQIGNIEFQFSLLGAIQAEKYRKEQAFQSKKGVWQNKMGLI